jgi:peroxiredoxin
MKQIFLFLFLLPIVTFSQSKTSAPTGIQKGFTIEGKLDGYLDGTKVSLYRNGSQTEWVSTKIQKGKFTLKQKVDDPTLCYIVIDGVEQPIEVFVENASISIKGSKGNAKYEIEGSKAHKDFVQFTSTFLPLVKQMNALVNTINGTMPGEERDKLMATYQGFQANIQKSIDQFIAEKPASPVGPFILNVTYQFSEDVVLLEQRYNKLDARIRNSAAGRELGNIIADKKVGSIGTMALDFSQPDTLGNMVSLSSFRGKYVLVDFWASWCGPCRNENPNVVENYKTFSNKNFTILSVSLDKPGQKDKWLQAINKDGLAWTHVSDLQFWDNAAARLYHIQSIPQNILVDPNGKIVGRNLRGPDLKAKLCEIFGCN